MASITAAFSSTPSSSCASTGSGRRPTCSCAVGPARRLRAPLGLAPQGDDVAPARDGRNGHRVLVQAAGLPTANLQDPQAAAVCALASGRQTPPDHEAGEGVPEMDAKPRRSPVATFDRHQSLLACEYIRDFASRSLSTSRTPRSRRCGGSCESCSPPTGPGPRSAARPNSCAKTPPPPRGGRWPLPASAGTPEEGGGPGVASVRPV
jgi:hypothetical protein